MFLSFVVRCKYFTITCTSHNLYKSTLHHQKLSQISSSAISHFPSMPNAEAFFSQHSLFDSKDIDFNLKWKQLRPPDSSLRWLRLSWYRRRENHSRTCWPQSPRKTLILKNWSKPLQRDSHLLVQDPPGLLLTTPRPTYSLLLKSIFKFSLSQNAFFSIFNKRKTKN